MYDLYDTSAVLYQLSYQLTWELDTLWVRNIPILHLLQYIIIFPGLSFTTAYAVCITTMINHTFISFSTVQILWSFIYTYSFTYINIIIVSYLHPGLKMGATDPATIYLLAN